MGPLFRGQPRAKAGPRSTPRQGRHRTVLREARLHDRLEALEAVLELPRLVARLVEVLAEAGDLRAAVRRLADALRRLAGVAPDTVVEVVRARGVERPEAARVAY